LPGKERGFALPTMLTPAQMRKIDPELAKLSDAELEGIRATLYEMADLAFDVWWQEKGGSKSPVGSFHSPEKESKL
jgi:hypothetical protein